MFMTDAPLVFVRVVVPSTDLPVSVETMKEHLRVDSDTDDDLIESYIRAAADRLDAPDGRLGIVLSERTLEVALDGFSPILTLPVGPVQSVVSVIYDDTAGVATTLAPEAYIVDTSPRMSGRVVPVGSWPQVQVKPGSVRVRWVAGGDCPEAVRQFIRLLVGEWYKNREIGSVEDAPVDLIARWRAYR